MITGFASIPSQAGPALQPLTSPDPQIIDMIQQVNESQLYYYDSHLTAFGPHYTGTETSMRVSQYIYDEFQAMGLAVEFHNWTFHNFTDRNVVATLPGTNPASNATFIFCAHHDTAAVSPGGDDDGAGVSVVLATAKILSQYTFNYTIRFITFSGEEQGLFGSYVYARDMSRRSDNIVAAIDVDSIGFTRTTRDERTIAFSYLKRSKWIVDFGARVSMLYRNQTNMTVSPGPLIGGILLSDFHSFDWNGFDTIYVCGMALTPLYHTENDTSDKVNWPYVTKITKLLLAVVAECASTPIELQVFIATPYQGYVYVSNNPQLSLDSVKNFRLREFGLWGSTIIFGRTTLTIKVISPNDPVNVIFCLDGIMQEVLYGNASSYSWVIHKSNNYPLSGKHVVQVYVMSENVASDEINIIIYQL
jgi:hypothetical protein